MTDQGPCPFLYSFISNLILKSEKPGSSLLSHSVPRAVPSAPKGLTSVFGMGTGVSPSSWLPGIKFKSLGDVPQGDILLRMVPWGTSPRLFCLNKLYGQASRSISTG